ncbi:alanine racemase [Protaetiibacter larvae]|uniref:Alanine racemase n=1 Tax=Protaetiibacter larvae TaxID=2592654 RepID=A0A5C1Y758_9MICO|nr:alanine racemase [Protaetiibacter larvae]QEO09278.1 alanine racemase [Protaetiibacter larvae]
MSVPLREARIHLDALAGNVEALGRRVAPAAVMVVVKADAYGHGMLPVAQGVVDAGADWLGVADLAEALALREAGIRTPVLAWLHGSPADFAAAAEADVDVAVSSAAQLEAAAAVGAAVHLKLDTGLSRNGVAPGDAEAVFARAATLEGAGAVRVRGIMSHLSGASRADDAVQRDTFATLVAAAEAAGLRPEVRHLAASLAALTSPDARFDLVRLGIAIYGVAPDASLDLAALGVRPVMELATQVAAVRRVPAGTGVSYGYVHRTGGETTLALVPLGYADGIPRHASDRAEVSIGGVRYPQVGRIAMDQFVVDVGDARVAVGDEVVVWGDPATGAPSAGEWADAAGTIGYEIVTRVGPRVRRVPVP